MPKIVGNTSATKKDKLTAFLDNFIAKKEGVDPDQVTLDYIRERRKERSSSDKTKPTLIWQEFPE